MEEPQNLSRDCLPSAMCVSLIFSSLHKSHKLRSVGRSREVLFSQGLSSVKTYPVTELRSLEVVRGEKCPSREGARR